MRNESSRRAAAYVVGAVCLVALVRVDHASAQAATAASPGAADSSIVVEKPTYVSIPLEITVNRPAAEVWKRIGKYCDISEWSQIAAGCTRFRHRR